MNDVYLAAESILAMCFAVGAFELGLWILCKLAASVNGNLPPAWSRRLIIEVTRCEDCRKDTPWHFGRGVEKACCLGACHAGPRE
jgi:hypothetical protein